MWECVWVCMILNQNWRKSYTTKDDTTSTTTTTTLTPTAAAAAATVFCECSRMPDRIAGKENFAVHVRY